MSNGVKENQLKIAFDLDGTLRDTHTLLRNVILKKTKFDISTNQSSYFISCPSLDDKQMVDLINRTMKNKSHLIEPYPNLAETMRQFVELTGEPIPIVTAIDKACKNPTIDWLDKHFEVEGNIIPYDLHLVRSSQKSEFLCQNGFKFFVDDRFRTANACSNVRVVYLIDQPWNRGRETSRNVIRVESVQEVLEHYMMLFNINKTFLLS